jgi:protein-L-isoaspartate(D-aspartate) O-methyltransferase
MGIGSIMYLLVAAIMLFSGTNNGDGLQAQRDDMVRTQIEARGITDSVVLAAMRKVPRHLFLPQNAWNHAHDDAPYSIGHGQTISQPYIVALMTELLRPKPHHRVLDVGTGSGYQAAVLAEIVDSVYTIEIICDLQEKADTLLKRLGYNNIQTRCGDGYDGWPEAAPFDGIIVAAAPEKVPQPLVDQLKDGGTLVIPVGDAFQYLEIYSRSGDRIIKEKSIPVRFVPMTGKAKSDDE